ncbi:MAG TPA: alpha/beta fold hydrolase [Rhizomicrobium sp.]|nr:alpha/beta fold hydrolase [Rhizomicrobium sp.]
MRPIRIALAFAALLFAAGSAPAAQTSLVALDPFLVAPDHLDNMELASFLAGDPDLADYTATALSADATSAAIALFETNSSASVTFQVNSAASLVSYADNFLTTAPANGQSSLTVSSLIQVGSTYFAPVLVQGPLSGYSANNTINLTATQGSANGSLSVPLVIPPLVLVHGLWGDKTSLSEAKNWLRSHAPWNSAPDFVVPICYSKYLRFDAKTDPLSGSDPCEVTSSEAVQTEIDSLLATTDSAGIVGGRVDLLVHSMGGLVARNYASQTKYGSLRNRMQGQFHAIVTLNTPEIGSTLANYLIKHRDGTRKAPLWTEQGLFWEAVCGTADVSKCFDAVGDPINAPTLPVKTGAVYSLEPDGPSLNNPNLSGPNIANATWRAVSSTRPGNSALATVLDLLIGGLYGNPDGKNVPTVDSILGNQPDDAIVTLASQTSGASGDQLYTFAKLSHTSLAGPILNLLTGVNDDSVVDDPSREVEKLAACWIETTGADSCLPAHKETIAASVEAPAGAHVAKIVPGLLAWAPTHATLGVPFEASLRLPAAAAALKSVSVYQQGQMGHAPSEAVAASAGTNGVVHLRVKPKLLGPVRFAVRAEFADGAVALRTLKVSIVPPSARPLAFRANDLPVLVLTLDSNTASAMPHPSTDYAAPVGSIDLPARFVRWQSVPQEGAPVVRVESNGVIHALRAGQAHVVAHFGSSTATLRILVRATQQ